MNGTVSFSGEPAAVLQLRSQAACGRAHCTAQPAIEPPLSGSAGSPAGWSAHLLELFLCYLNLADLVRCSQVCQRWRQVAGDPALQARILMRTYPPFYKQRLTQAQASRSARFCLASWCQGLPPGSVRRLQLESLMAREVCAEVLFLELRRQMLGTARLSAFSYQSVCHPGWAGIHVTSPDGRLIADVRDCDDFPFSRRVTLWQYNEKERLHLRFSASHTQPVRALFFSADSKVLQAIDSVGSLRTWVCPQEAQPAAWQETTRTGLCPAMVQDGQISEDGRFLAARMPDSVQVFSREAGTGWQLQWRWLWQASGRRSRAAHRGAGDGGHWMTFSHDSRHLVLQTHGEMFLAWRTGERWQEQTLVDEQGAQLDSLWSGVFDGNGRFLALGFDECQGPRALPSGRCGILLCRFVAGAGWLGVSRHIYSGSCADWSLCLVFSADGQQLAFAAEQSRRESRVCVVPVQGRSVLHDGVVLSFASRSVVQRKDKSCIIDSIQFSANGRVLVATAEAGVHVWRRCGADWVSMAWIVRPGRALRLRHALSPDGYHLALAQGEYGEVSIWGPGPDGHYIRKVRLLHGRPLRSLEFAPDGSHLQMRSRGEREGRVLSTWLACLRLTPEVMPVAQGDRTAAALRHLS